MFRYLRILKDRLPRRAKKKRRVRPDGRANFERVRAWYETHLGGKQVECANALGLSVMAVNRHVKELRAEWSGED